jgi:hypothetical protein
MNKKLALKTSKHPLIKKLMEDRTIPNSVIANLIVEEITEAAGKPTLASALMGVERDLKNGPEKFLKKYNEQKKFYSSLDQLPERQQEMYKQIVDGYIKALLAQQSPETKAQGEELEKKVDNTMKKISDTDPEDNEGQLDQDSQDDKEYTQFVNAYKDEMKTFDGREKQALYLFTVELNKNLPKNVNEDTFTTLTQGFVNLVPQEQDVLLKQSIGALDDKTKQVLVGIVNDVNKKLAALKIIRHALDLEAPQPQTEPEAKEEPTQTPTETTPEPETAKELSGDQETTPDEAGENEDPEKFDVDPEALQDLIRVSEEFIEEFYEKALLRDQGKLVRNVLDQLVKITEKEELEKAAQRRPQPKPEEGEQVQEQQQSPNALRNIQVDLKSFIKLAKRSKEVLQRFDEASDKGKVIGSSLKKKFMEMLAQLQENIRDLVQDISKLNLVQEAKDTSEIEKKWDAIEKGYNDASRALSNIIAAGSEEKEAFDMEKNVGDAYNALMSISHFFPSVNPFGKKTSQDMKKYSEQYGAAIKDVKSVLRDVLELSQGQGGRSTASNAIKALKEFSGQIQSIFDVKSKFDDVVVQPNERAAQGEPQPQVEKEKSYADILKDKVLSFLGVLISKGKNKRDIQSNIEKQEELEPEEKEAATDLVEKYDLDDLQQKAKMTSEEMKLYIQLLIALEEKKIVKLNEAVVIPDNIQDVIKRQFSDNQEQIIAILKKPGVLPHLLNISTDNFGEKGYETFDDQEDGEEYPPYPEDTRYLSREEYKLIDGEYLEEAKERFFQQIQEATRKHYKNIGRIRPGRGPLPNDGMPFVADLAALKMVNQKQKTATAEENNKALENIEGAKDIKDAEDPFDIHSMKNFEQFLGNLSEYKDYKGSKKIIASYLGNKLRRYNKIIDYLNNETLKSIKEYINEEPKKKKGYVRYNRKFEEQIATKLKPLIREMLNKGK